MRARTWLCVFTKLDFIKFQLMVNEDCKISGSPNVFGVGENVGELTSLWDGVF